MISLVSSLMLAGTVVLGGTLEAVRAALAAKASGKDVTVYAPRPYLGEDRAGTYDLRRHADDDPDDLLVREIFNPAYGAADAYAVKWGTNGWHACERIEPFANRTNAAPSSVGLADVTTPFLVKRALDRALLKAGVKFVTGAVVIEVREHVILLATRTGVVTVPVDEVVDCRIPGPSEPGDYVYAWNVVRDRAHPRVETVETRVRLDAVSPRALAAAERQARGRLFAPDLLDIAPFPMIRPVGKTPVPRRGPRAPAQLSADVVVVGGGTGGAPAAIAAARRGAKVAVVEFMNVLGGVTTEGRICGYYHGNICGFTEEVDAGMADLAEVPWIAKGEWYRRELGRVGADVFFGAFGYGVVKTDNRVTGVRVAFPDGSTCVISCKAVIDATGNCDIAAAAGCETDFISADELSLQGAGVAPQPLGVSGLNADVGFVDETSVEDISGFLLRTRLSLPDRVWNVSQMTDSRERRRLVGVLRLMPSDILAGRIYRDTICETISNFDTHGQTVSDIFFVRSPGKRGDVHRAQVPYRCLLPKDVDGLLVTGLGVSAHRDAMPVLRMQPDIQNVGYAAGVAAAQAVEKGVSPRQIDVKDLQRHLIAVGNVGSHVLTDVDSPRVNETVFRDEDCSEFLAKLKASEWDAGWDFKGMSQFGRSVSDVDMLLIALGKCRFAAAAEEIVRKADALTAGDAYSHFRAIALAAEGCVTDSTRQRLAKSLHRLLSLPGVGGHMRTRSEPVPGFADAAADRERTLVLRELALARALYTVGDCGALGYRTLCDYKRDYRKAYANHARLALERKFEIENRVRATRQAPVCTFRNERGGLVCDFGQAAVGWLELCEWPKGDYEVVLGELADASGAVTNAYPTKMIRCQRLAGRTDGSADFRVPMPPDDFNLIGWDPEAPAVHVPAKFGVVFPFRYAEIVRAPEGLAVTSVVRQAVHWPIDLSRSDFITDNEDLNRLYRFFKHSVWATSYCGLYIDGDRERTPYEADAYISQLAHYAIDDDPALARRTHAWLMDHPTWPTEWKFHSILMAWADWMQTGDREPLVQFYDRLRDEKVDAGFKTRADGLLVSAGDAPGLPRDIVDWPPDERFGFEFRPVNAVVNAFRYGCLVRMADIARVLSKAEDAQMFEREAARVRAAFQAVFYDPVRRLYVDGEGASHISLHANAAALAFGLVPEDRKGSVADFLAKEGMKCSVYFAQYLLEALYASGRGDLALDVILSKGDRSWLGMMEFGSTVSMEAWNVKVNSRIDLTHLWGAAPLNHLIRHVAGVTPLEPGFARVRIAPSPGTLKSIRTTVPSCRGPIALDLTFAGESVTGTVHLPTATPGVFEWNGRSVVLAPGSNSL